MTRGLISIAAISLALTGGCASVMEQYPGEPPPWFVAAQKEVEGEGYPELADIPETRAPVRNAVQQQRAETDLRTTRQAVENQNPYPEAPHTADEIRAMAAQLRAATEEDPAPEPQEAP